VKFIKLGRLTWAGYIKRMEESVPARKVLFTKRGGSGDRKRGRQKLGCTTNSKEDVARVEGRNWRINALSREE
jgi:hypothetical protein